MKKFISLLLILIVLAGCTPGEAPTESVYLGNVYSNGVLLSANSSGVPYIGATQDLDLGANGLTTGAITNSGLTQWRLVTVGANGLLNDNANLTYSGGKLNTNAMSIGVTANKVLIAGIGVQNTIEGTANFTLDVATNTLTIPYPKWTDNTSTPTDTTTPVTWLPVKLPDGTTAYIPTYK